jgi:hypothetical protein
MNDAFNPWQVQVTGSAAALEHLLEHFAKPPLRFSAAAQPGLVEFQSDSFLSCSTVDEVRAIATRELHVISGVVAIDRRSSDILRLGPVFRNNRAGGRDAIIAVESVVMMIEPGEVSLTHTRTDSDGNQVVVEPPPPGTVALARAALTDEGVGKAMRLVMANDFRKWVDLYSLHEVIEADVGGMRALAARGWGSAADLKALQTFRQFGRSRWRCVSTRKRADHSAISPDVH